MENGNGNGVERVSRSELQKVGGSRGRGGSKAPKYDFASLGTDDHNNTLFVAFTSEDPKEREKQKRAVYQASNQHRKSKNHPEHQAHKFEVYRAVKNGVEGIGATRLK